MSDNVLVARAGGIATVTLNRPASLNALTRAMWGAVRDTFRALDADADLRCIVLRGAGERAFCPGADISEFSDARATADQARVYGALIHETLEAIGGCRHPVVAMIHGPRTGGGLELATMCDLRLAGESGRFGIPINRLGVVLGYPEFRAFLGLAGNAVAMELLLEGKVIGAAEALAKGLVNRVVPDTELAAETEDYREGTRAFLEKRKPVFKGK